MNARTTKSATSHLRSLVALLLAASLHLRSVSLENATSTTTPVSGYKVPSAIASSEVTSAKSGTTTLTESVASTLVSLVSSILLD